MAALARTTLLAILAFACASTAAVAQAEISERHRPHRRALRARRRGGYCGAGAGRSVGRALGLAVIVENRTGAATSIGTNAVATAIPDGHTLLLTATPFLVNPTLQPNLPYDTLRDFAGVSMVVEQPVALVAHPSVPANTLKRAGRRRQEERSDAGLRVVGDRRHLPPARRDVCADGGHQAAARSVPGQRRRDRRSAGRQHSAAVRFRLLGQEPGRCRQAEGPGDLEPATAARDAERADVCRGLSRLRVRAACRCCWRRPRRPKPVIERLSTDVQSVVNSPAYAARVKTAALHPLASTGPELDAFIRSEIVKWGTIIREANIQSGR